MIRLTEINKDKVKAGDTVGIADNVQIGWSDYKHLKIRAVKISRITQKRTKFISEEGDEFNKYVPFYLLDEIAMKETKLALAMEKFYNAYCGIDLYKRKIGFENIPDENIVKIADLMSEVVEILNGMECDTD